MVLLDILHLFVGELELGQLDDGLDGTSQSDTNDSVCTFFN
jgi:hypothetical protein